MQVDLILNHTLTHNTSFTTLPEQETAQEAFMLEMGAALFGAVMAEKRDHAEETRTALRAVRAALDSARHLRYARTRDERQRRAEEAQRTQAAQEEALRSWYGYHRAAQETAAPAPHTSPQGQAALGI